MKPLIFSIIILSALTLSAQIARAQSEKLLWVKQAGGSAVETSSRVAVDRSENIIISGRFFEKTSLGNDTLISRGGEDIFVAKFDSGGNVLWATSMGGTSTDRINDITTDASDNIIVAGRFTSTEFEIDTLSLSNAGSDDMLIVKLDPHGKVLWAKRAGGADLDRALGVATDSLKNIIVIGYFSGTAIFDSTMVTSAGDWDVFVAKYDSLGKVLWVRSAGGKGTELGADIATNRTNEILVTGSFEETANLDATALTSIGKSDIFVAKYDELGNLIWAQRAGGAASDIGIHVEASNTFAAVMGTFEGAAIFGSGPGSIFLQNKRGSGDVFVAQFLESGELKAAMQIDGKGAFSPGDLALDDSSNIIVTSSFTDSTFFANKILTSAGSWDIFIAKYDQDLNLIDAKRSGGISSDFGNGVVTNKQGDVLATGSFQGTALFDTTSLTSAGNDDIFLAKYRIMESTRPPLAPSNLTAEVSGDSLVALLWQDNSTDEKGFKIFRNNRFLVQVSPNSVSYEDHDVAEDSTYHYTILAFNNKGDSDSSNSVAVTTALKAPSDCEVQAVGYYFISLTWQNHSAKASGCKIARSLTGAEQSYELLATLEPSTESYTDLHLAIGTAYYYKIFAYSSRTQSEACMISQTTNGSVDWLQEKVPFDSVASWTSFTNERTNSIAWGDVDGDGDLDLAAGNFDEPITIYINNNGELESRPSWTSTSTYKALSVAWGDVDLDGDLDLACSNWGQPIIVFLNFGGALEKSPSWSSELNFNTNSIAWGDVDNDGDLDLACANENQPNVLFVNHGGKLEKRPSWAPDFPQASFSVAWGDMNQDGYLDLAFGNDDEPNTVYLNRNGVIETNPSWLSALRDNTREIAWGDVDGDGDLDLACANNDGYNERANTVYFNKNGILEIFPSWSSTPVRHNSSSVDWGDIDGDGDLDLISKLIYLNRDGSLEKSPSWASGILSNVAFVLSDIDGDGDLDLTSGDSRKSIYFNKSVPLETIPFWTASQSINTNSIALGDVDGDGDLDLACGNSGTFSSPNAPSTIYLNNGGTFDLTPYWTSEISHDTRKIALGDMDGDGDLDLVCGNYNQPCIIYRNSNGIFETKPFWSSGTAYTTESIILGDINQDGGLDLVCGNRNHPNVLYLNYSGVLSKEPDWSAEQSDATLSMALGDVDGDGDLDLACGNSGPNTLYINDKGIFRRTPSWFSQIESATSTIAWGDVDGDSDLDLACDDGIYLNKEGVLETTVSWTFAPGDNAVDIAWGDVDGDGDLDLACANNIEGSRNSLYLNRRGVLKREWTSDPYDATTSVALGDLDEDGDLDLVFGNIDGGPNLAYLNRINLPQVNKLPNNWSFIRSIRELKIDLNSNVVAIKYELTDAQGDKCTILPKYSTNGGGRWFKATEGIGSDGVNELSATPDGVIHNFVWDIETDKIQGKDVLLWLQVFSQASHTGHIQRPYTSFQLHFRMIDTSPNIEILFPIDSTSIGGSTPIIGRIWDDINFDHFEIANKERMIFRTNTPQREVTELYLLNSDALEADTTSLTIRAIDIRGNIRTKLIPVHVVLLPAEPRVQLQYPRNNSHDVSLNSPIIARFNSKMNQVAINSQTMRVLDVQQRTVAGNLNYNYQSRTLTFVPTQPLQGKAFYYVTIDNNFNNEAGIPLGATAAWSFKTQDNQVPFDIIRIAPNNGTVGVLITDSIKVTLDFNSLYQFITIHELGDSTAIKGNVRGVPRKSDDQRDIIFRPQTNWKGSAVYLITLATDTVASHALTYTSYFTTEDIETLQITDFKPENGETISPLNFEISVSFSKAMNDNTLDSTTVFLMKGDIKIPSIITYSENEQKVLITPQVALEEYAVYTATIRATVQERGGHELGFDFVWYFRTTQIIRTTGGIVSEPMVRVTIPPHALLNNTPIIIKKVHQSLEQYQPTDSYQKLVGEIYDLLPADLTFDKPATLQMKTVVKDNNTSVDEKKITICAWEGRARRWFRVGGAVYRNGDTISVHTALKKLGTFAILEDASVGQAFSISNLNCQPRVFSPRSTGLAAETNISFELGKESNVTMKVYNSAGRLIRILLENEYRPLGTVAEPWDGKDHRGEHCPSGLYIIAIRAQNNVATKTVVIMNQE